MITFWRWGPYLIAAEVTARASCEMAWVGSGFCEVFDRTHMASSERIWRPWGGGGCCVGDSCWNLYGICAFSAFSRVYPSSVLLWAYQREQKCTFFSGCSDSIQVYWHHMHPFTESPEGFLEVAGDSGPWIWSMGSAHFADVRCFRQMSKLVENCTTFAILLNVPLETSIVMHIIRNEWKGWSITLCFKVFSLAKYHHDWWLLSGSLSLETLY